MTDEFDPTTQRALNRFEVPPLSPSFADRVVTRALELPPLPPRRPAQRAWTRGSGILAGIAAFSLMSAAAAENGVFGERVRQSVRTAPVLGPIIASVTPVQPKPVPKAKLAAKPVHVTPPPVAIVPDITPPDIAEPQPLFRRERIAERIAARMAQREARGLRPLPPRRAQIIRKLRQLPPDERRALMLRVRELRREQQVEGAAPDETLRMERKQTRRAWRREQWRQQREIELRPTEPN